MSPHIPRDCADPFRSLWFLGVGRVKPATPGKVERVEQGPSLPAGIATGWYYIFAVIEPVRLLLLFLVWFTDRQLVMITAALGILFVPGEYGRGLLPERYERPTSGMGNTVRGQMVLGGLGSCKLHHSPHSDRILMLRFDSDFTGATYDVSPHQEYSERSARCG